MTGETNIPSAEERYRTKLRNEAWISRIEQLYQQAKGAFGNEKSFLQIKQKYDEIISRVEGIRKQSKEKNDMSVLLIAAIIVPAVVILGICFLIMVILSQFLPMDLLSLFM